MTKSLNDNKNIVVANLDGLEIQINGGEVDIYTHPNGWDETDDFKITGRNAFTASKAILGYYPAATAVKVFTRVDVTDAYGNKSVDAATFIFISLETSKKYSYDGLAGRVISGPSNMYCISDKYHVALYLWKNISAKDRGCVILPDGP